MGKRLKDFPFLKLLAVIKDETNFKERPDTNFDSIFNKTYNNCILTFSGAFGIELSICACMPIYTFDWCRYII